MAAQYNGLKGNMTVIAVALPTRASCNQSVPPLTLGSGIKDDTAFMHLTPPVMGGNLARGRELIA